MYLYAACSGKKASGGGLLISQMLTLTQNLIKSHKNLIKSKKMIFVAYFFNILFSNVFCVVKPCFLKSTTTLNVCDFSLNALVAPPLSPMVVIGNPRSHFFDAG